MRGVMRQRMETALEVTARVIGSNYGVTVEFEGDEAFTDGKRIRLPHFGELDGDQRRELDGYLDHEVGHILFTDFSAWNQIGQDFHRSLANFAEDVRIEREMAGRYAGAGRHLKFLRGRIEAEQDAKWADFSLPFRFGGAMQRILQGRPFPNDPELVHLLITCREEIKALGSASSTAEVIFLTARIVEKLKNLFDEPEPPAMQSPGEGEAGEGMEAPPEEKMPGITGEMENMGGSEEAGEEGVSQSGKQEERMENGSAESVSESKPNDAGSETNEPKSEGKNSKPTDSGEPGTEKGNRSGKDPEEVNPGESETGKEGEVERDPEQGSSGESGTDKGGQKGKDSGKVKPGESEKEKGNQVGEAPERGNTSESGPEDEKQGEADSKEEARKEWDKLRSEAKRVMNDPKSHAAAEKEFGADLADRIREAMQEWLSREAMEFESVPPTEGVARRFISNGETLPHPFLAATRRFDRELKIEGDRNTYHRLAQSTKAATTKLKVELERNLFAVEPAHFVLDLEEGELDPETLYGVRTGSRDVFREYRRGRVFNTALSMLVDCSGSMEGVMGIQKQALCAMGESLRGLNVPFEITGFRSMPDIEAERFSQNLSYPERFNRTRSRVEYLLAKQFRDRRLEGITGLKADGGTPLNEAVAWAGRRLDLQAATRKVLIVFTDGEPCGCGDNRVLRNDLLLQVHRLEAIGIEVVAFAINCPTVGRFFPRVINISKISDLERQGLKEIRRVLDPANLGKRVKKQTA